MAYSERLPKSKRAGLLAGIAATHIGLIMLLMTIREAPQASILKSGPLSVSLLPANTRPPRPPHIVLQAKQPAPPEAKPVPAPSLAAPSSSQNPGADCAVLDQLQKAITANADARAAIDQLPVEEQSLSDATVIWNAGWTDVANTSSAPLATVRDTIVEALGAIEARCLEDSVIGPRMIAIPSGQETRLLVIGSGTWTWQQLADEGIALPVPDLGSVSTSVIAPDQTRQKGPLESSRNQTTKGRSLSRVSARRPSSGNVPS